MHLPYGMLDNATTLLTTNALAAGGAAVAFRRLNAIHAHRLAPLLGSTAAFVFAAQMVNFPVGGGTSGHLIGGTLAAVVVGPWGAAAALTAVLVVQCLMFADGGLLELGANVVNMALIGGAGAWCVYRAGLGTRPSHARIVAAAMAAAWLSVVAAAACCSIELAAAGAARLGPTLAAMLGIHSIIGIGEAAITGLIVAALLKLRPECVQSADAADLNRRTAWRPMAIAVIIAAFTVAAFLAPVASDLPDGLETIANSLGFAAQAQNGASAPAPMPDYELPALAGLAIAKSAAGAIGVATVAALAFLLARVAAKQAADSWP